MSWSVTLVTITLSQCVGTGSSVTNEVLNLITMESPAKAVCFEYMILSRNKDDPYAF